MEIKTDKIIQIINKKDFSRHDILMAATREHTSFKESDMRNLLEKLLTNRSIVRVSRNLYRRNEDVNITSVYEPVYSEESRKLIRGIQQEYPLLKFQVWELSWFNEFLMHLVAQNVIFLDVENDGCEFVYSSFSDSYKGKMLLRPTSKELQYYSKGDGIIVERLVSESPKGKNHAYETPLEKLVVELFANKSLRELISQGDFAYILETVFEKYHVDQTKMFRYARRRNKQDELARYIKEHTSIHLLSEC
ncbi:MAG: hypothetical protein J5750_00060 [Clostridiales bacterium]|nr:hypothetical protein [Clostridiales bacterium]